MHLSGVQETTPVCLFFSSALNGHAATQNGSRQCMHCRFTNAYSAESFPVPLYSLMMFLVWALRSLGAWWMESSVVSGSSPLASAQATTHDLHPMQRVESYNMPTAFGGTTGVCASATAPRGSAQAVPPTTPILSRSRRLSDMSRSRALVFMGATLVDQLLFRHWMRLLGEHGRTLINRFLTALEALRRGPRCTHARSYEQSDDARGDAGWPALRGVDSRVGVGWRKFVNGGSFENRHLKSDALFGAAHARCANADRPDVGHFVELADRTTSVSVRALASEFVETPAVTVSVVAKLLGKASGIKVGAPRTLLVNYAVISELGAQVGIQFRRRAGAHNFQHGTNQDVGIWRAAREVNDRNALDEVRHAHRSSGIVARRRNSTPRCA